MKKFLSILIIALTVISCETKGKDGKPQITLPRSSGNTNKIMTVVKSTDWDGAIGNEIRRVFGEHQVGLPQPETLLSVSQIDPSGFVSFIRNGKSVFIVRKGKDQGIKVIRDKYATPQIIVTLTGQDEHDIINLINTKGKEIIQTFKDEDIKFVQNIFKKEAHKTKFETLEKLGLEVIIPKRYRLVDDTGDFLWLRQRLSSGIARGDGNNNILVYSVPLVGEAKVVDNITAVRDTIGKKYIPGSKEGMYMITEKAYTPFTYDAVIDGKKAYETRGKWEVKNDFMAGPFINYTVLDKANNRLIVFEGFTYAPSVNKREFVFELEAIAKTLKIK